MCFSKGPVFLWNGDNFNRIRPQKHRLAPLIDDFDNVMGPPGILPHHVKPSHQRHTRLLLGINITRRGGKRGVGCVSWALIKPARARDDGRCRDGGRRSHFDAEVHMADASVYRLALYDLGLFYFFIFYCLGSRGIVLDKNAELGSFLRSICDGNMYGFLGGFCCFSNSLRLL